MRDTLPQRPADPSPLEELQEAAQREALLASEQRLSLALQSARMGMWEWDVRVDRSVWSTTEYEVLGLPVGSGRETADSFFACIHPEDLPGLRKSLDRLMEDGSEWHHNCRILRPDGEVRWLAGAGRLYRDPEGRPLRMLGVNYDITEQKQATAALARAEALAETNRQKDTFIAMLGHELRNPLVPICNAVALMQRSCTSRAQEDALALIDRQLTHLTRLLDDLLDISRIERGTVSLRTADFDLAQTVQSAVLAHRPLLEADGISLSFDAPSRPLWARGDAERIVQIMSNLLTNAGKFTDRGGRASVELTAEDGRVAVLTVRDTGIGMDAETLQSIFRPFAQADRSIDRHRSGLGLGLTLVKSIVELHGGSVRGSSPGLGRGSEFQVRLPILTEAPKEAPRAPEVAIPQATPLRMLIVEDNVEAANTLQLLLGDSGHEVAVAYTGPDGLKLARTFRPEVLLCDVGLPGGMDGYALATAMRADPELRSAFLIAMTGYGQDRDREDAEAAGFDLHLTKPVDVDDLERLIAEHVPRR